MASAGPLVRRVVLAVGLVFALAVMHSELGPAMSCAGGPSTAMAMMPMEHGRSLAATHPMTPGDDVQHQQPPGQPASAHGAEMCVSTPAATGAGAPRAGPAAIGIQVVDLPTQAGQPVVLAVAATGREPPTSDPVSELSVIRT
jgi:hypothetical protein